MSEEEDFEEVGRIAIEYVGENSLRKIGLTELPAFAKGLGNHRKYYAKVGRLVPQEMAIEQRQVVIDRLLQLPEDIPDDQLLGEFVLRLNRLQKLLRKLMPSGEWLGEVVTKAKAVAQVVANKVNSNGYTIEFYTTPPGVAFAFHFGVTFQPTST